MSWHFMADIAVSYGGFLAFHHNPPFTIDNIDLKRVYEQGHLHLTSRFCVCKVELHKIQKLNSMNHAAFIIILIK